MALQFESGDPASPRGHALVYFTDLYEPAKIGASYIVVLPINVDLAKYVPPFLAGQVESMGAADMSAFSFPPAPEPVESIEHARRLAEKRGDDLIYGGAHRLEDAASLMGVVSDITSEYHALYEEHAKAFAAAPASVLDEPANGDESGVDDFLYGLMSEPDLLNEVTNLVGKLRFAIDGGDTATAEESELRIRAAGKFMPENRRTDQLADAAASRSPNAEQLARLYLERAYGLLKEDYLAVKGAEEQIEQLTSGNEGASDPAQDPG